MARLHGPQSTTQKAGREAMQIPTIGTAAVTAALVSVLVSVAIAVAMRPEAPDPEDRIAEVQPPQQAEAEPVGPDTTGPPHFALSVSDDPAVVTLADVAVNVPAGGLTVLLHQEDLGDLRFHNAEAVRVQRSVNLASSNGSRVGQVEWITGASARITRGDVSHPYICKEQPTTRSAFDVWFQCWRTGP